MSILTGSFEYNGAKVTVQKPNGASRIRVWQLRQSLREFGNGGVDKDVADYVCYYLANTVAVEGTLGFPVPIENPTHDELIVFVRGVAEADEQLVVEWDAAIYQIRNATNDPDLLPPQELDEKKEPPKKSNSKE